MLRARLRPRRLVISLAALALLAGHAVPASGAAPSAVPASVAVQTAPEPEPGQSGAGATSAEPGAVLDLLTGLEVDDNGVDGAHGQQSEREEGSAERPSGVDDEVTAQVADEGRAAVIVRLSEQSDLAAVEREAVEAGRAAAAAAAREVHGQGGPADLARVAQDAAREARGTTVVASLQATAEQT